MAGRRGGLLSSRRGTFFDCQSTVTEIGTLWLVLGPLPCTMTTPVSGVGAGVGVPPELGLPLLPQLRLAAHRAASITPSATCRGATLHRRDCGPPRRGLGRTISRRQASTKIASSHPPNRLMWGGAGKVDAEDVVVIVTVVEPPGLAEVGFTEQVVPASVLDSLQVKLTLPEKLLIGVTAIVAVPLLPAWIVSLDGVTPSRKSSLLVEENALHAVARFKASIDPSPLAKSYPTAAL